MPDPTPAEAFAELRRRAGGDARRLEAIAELERRRGVTPKEAAPDVPVYDEYAGMHPVAREQAIAKEREASRPMYLDRPRRGHEHGTEGGGGVIGPAELQRAAERRDPVGEAIVQKVIRPIGEPILRAHERSAAYERATEERDAQAKQPRGEGPGMTAGAPSWLGTTRANMGDYAQAFGGALMAIPNLMRVPAEAQRVEGSAHGVARELEQTPRALDALMGAGSEAIKKAAGERPKFAPQPIFDTSDIEPELQIAVPSIVGGAVGGLVGDAVKGRAMARQALQSEAMRVPSRVGMSDVQRQFGGIAPSSEPHPLGPLAPPSIRRAATLPSEPMSLDAGGLRARVDTIGPAMRQRMQFDPTGETAPLTKPQSRMSLPEPRGSVLSTEGPPVRTEGTASLTREPRPVHERGGQMLGEFDTRMRPQDFVAQERRAIQPVAAEGSPGPTVPDPFDPMQEQSARGKSQGTPTGIRGQATLGPEGTGPFSGDARSGPRYGPEPAPPAGPEAPTPKVREDYVPPKTPPEEIAASRGFLAGAAAQGRPLIESLKKLGASGRETFDRLVSAQTEHRKNAGAALQALDDVMGRTSKDFKENFGNYVEGRSTPRNAEESAALAWWKETHPKIRETVNSSGSRVLDEDAPGGYREIGTTENFYPHQMLPEIAEKIASGDPATIQTLRDLNVGKTFKDAAALDDYLGRYRSEALKPTNPGTEFPRKIIVPPEWQDMSMRAVEKYVDSAYKSAAEHRAFAYRDPSSGAPRYVGPDGRPQGDLGPLMAQMEREFPGGSKEAKTIIERVMGRERGTPAGRWWRSAQALEGAWYAGTRLTGPKTALVQLGSIASSVAKSPLGDVVGGMMDYVKAPRESYRLGVSEGAIQPPSRFGNVIGFSDNPVGAVGQAATKATNAMLAPMGFMDSIPRSIAVRVAERYGKTLTSDLAAGGDRAINAQASMRGLRFSEAQIADALAGKPIDMTKLRQQFVRQTSGEATLGERLPALSDPKLLFLSRGKNFGIAQAQNAWDIAAKPIAANPGSVEAYAPLAKLIVGSLAVGEVVAATKDVFTGPQTGRPTFDEIEKKGIPAMVRRAMDDLHDASAFGILGDTAEKGVRGLAGDKMALGDFAENTLKPTSFKTGEDFWRAIDGVTNSKTGKAKTEAVQRWLRQTFNGPVGWKDAYDSFTDEGLRERAQSARDPATKRAIRDRRKLIGATFGLDDEE